MKEETEKKKSIFRYLPLAGVIIIVLIVGFLWYKEYSKYVTTDDAHVDSDIVSVSSKILGRIIHLYADEGDTVKQGMLLAELDSTDLLAQREQAKAMKNQAIASKIQSDAKYNYDNESIKTVQVSLEKAQEDYTRAKEQIAGNVISKEQFDHTKKAFESAQAQLEAAKTNLLVSKAQIGNSTASVETAYAQIGVIETQLKNTKIYAPFNGIVAKRWLLPGDVAQPGQSILTLTNNNRFWVISFLEETKMSDVHLNSKSLFTIDAIPGVTFYGKIYEIGSNTASQFSLIPPNNAAGNFTKVTQRIPVKISIDGVDKKNLSDYKILAGMSVVVKIVK
ncbi:MAG: HlyD family secretion protein [FCB group bacterium]